jgi:hypothetical protein
MVRRQTLSRKATKNHNEVSRWRSITAKLDRDNERKAREGKKSKSA